MRRLACPLIFLGLLLSAEARAFDMLCDMRGLEPRGLAGHALTLSVKSISFTKGSAVLDEGRQGSSTLVMTPDGDAVVFKTTEARARFEGALSVSLFQLKQGKTWIATWSDRDLLSVGPTPLYAGTCTVSDGSA